ncbi:MAG: hypothetical protein GY699_02605 [Desulfobacteraceae bacterium]|nr:hypothetical protein [Desulfobacteraceae bacterium]
MVKGRELLLDPAPSVRSTNTRCPGPGRICSGIIHSWVNEVASILSIIGHELPPVSNTEKSCTGVPPLIPAPALTS